MHHSKTDRISCLLTRFYCGQKVDIHEIEERKNLHINDLMRNHEKAFGQMKAYYNDITNDNLKAREREGVGGRVGRNECHCRAKKQDGGLSRAV